MAFQNPYGPLVRRKFATDQAPNARWELSSNPANKLLGFPADAEANNATPGEITVDSQLVQVTPPRYRYVAEMRPPTSSLVTDSQDAYFALIAHENTGRTAVNEWASDGSIGNLDKGNLLLWDDNGVYLVGTPRTDRLWANDPANPAVLETWHNFPLANSWVNMAGFSTQYRRTAVGDVYVKGRINAGVSGTVGTLPVGYRPPQTVDIALKSNNDAGTMSWVQITSGGTVNVVGNVAAAQVWLAFNFSFHT